MTGHFSSRKLDHNQAVADSASLPLRSDESRVIESEFVALRFATQRIDEQEVVTRLELEARHPKVEGDARVFDLTSILAEGYRRHPGTVAQIVNPELSMDARLDALYTMAVYFAGIRDSLPPLNDPLFTTSSTRALDDGESSFGIKNVVLTKFGDALRGYARRGVTVVRNEEPWIQFHIVENHDGLCDASIVVLPKGLELPLLDRNGEPVVEATLNEAIHDFTHLLRQGRYEPELMVLERLASELTGRLARNTDAPRALKKRNFAHEVAKLARDEILWAREASTGTSYEALQVSHGDFEARQLPDGRMLWVSHRQLSLSSHVRVLGESLEGARYELLFHYPPPAHQLVARLFDKLIRGKQWPRFDNITDLLHSNPQSALAMVIPTSMESYPSAVNSLMRQIQREAPELSVERGVPQETLFQMDPYLSNFMSELVMGRSPFHTVIDNGNLAESWRVQAFLDHDLKGSVYAMNALGGSIVIRDQSLPRSTEFRRTELLKFFKTFADDSSRITSDPNRIAGFLEARRNLPKGQWNDARAYETASRAASLCWKAFVKERCFSPQQRASDKQWCSQKVSDGVWTVSMVAPGGRRGWLPYLITFNVIPDGITEISFSNGARGIFGGLWGKRISSEGKATLPEGEVELIVRVLIHSSRGTLGMSIPKAVNRISRDLRCTLLSSLRDVDPERARYDCITRFLNYLKRTW